MLACPVSCGGLAWFIAGMVFRYREIGNICSGDYYRDEIEAGTITGRVGDAPYQWKSGKFLNIYYMIILWTMAVCCGIGCCISICGMVMGSR